MSYSSISLCLPLTHLGISLVINKIDAQIFFYSKFISCLYMYRAPCGHRQEVKIVLYNIWYHHTYRWSSRAQLERGGLVGMHSNQFFPNLCTERQPIGVMIPDAV